MNNGNDAMRRKALLAGAIGNFVEYYDFFLYGAFTTTIAHLFFPKSSPTAALLSTFAIFAISFLIRPLGAIAFGHLGDKVGRRPSLLISVMLMSAGTLALGLLPGYAQIGAAAPALLLFCRLVQAFSAGGETSSATVLVIEHAPPGRRGRYASYIATSPVLGAAFGMLVSVAMTSTTTPEQLAAWGWRVPFLATAPLALIGLYLRMRVDESPAFTALRDHGNIESAPVIQALKAAKKPMLVMIGWAMTNAVGSYLLTTFFVSYLTTTAKFSNTASLVVELIALVAVMLGCVLAGLAIDVIGRKRVAVGSALALGAWAIPAFMLLKHSTVLGAAAVSWVYGFLLGGIIATSALAIVELFPVRLRTSASGLSYQLAYALFGGTAPYLATWLVGRGHPTAPGYYLAGLCAVSAVVAAVAIGNRASANGLPPTSIEHSSTQPHQPNLT